MYDDIISFTVPCHYLGYGFKNNPLVATNYNPIGAVRTTSKQKYTDIDYNKYKHFQEHIRNCFKGITGCYPEDFFSKKDKVYVGIIIYFKTGVRHSDSDNVFKSVTDAIFKPESRNSLSTLDDNKVVGSHYFKMCKPDETRIEVKMVKVYEPVYLLNTLSNVNEVEKTIKNIELIHKWLIYDLYQCIA